MLSPPVLAGLTARFLTIRYHRYHRLMFFLVISSHCYHCLCVPSPSLCALTISPSSHRHSHRLSAFLPPVPCSPSQFSPSPRALTVSCVMTVLAGSRETLLGTRSAPSHHCPADMAGSAPAVAGNSSPWKSRYVCQTKNEGGMTGRVSGHRWGAGGCQASPFSR